MVAYKFYSSIAQVAHTCINTKKKKEQNKQRIKIKINQEPIKSKVRVLSC